MKRFSMPFEQTIPLCEFLRLDHYCSDLRDLPESFPGPAKDGEAGQ
jgi:hypothetical protein